MMRQVSNAFAALMVVVFVFLIPGKLHGQIADGSIEGIVTDPTDSAVVGATVIAANVATRVETRTKTTSIGYYLFPVLPAGTYNVTVEEPGFQRTTSEGLVLHSGSKLRADMKLVLGQTTQSIQVVGTAPLVNSTTTDVGTVIESREVTQLPFNGRNFTQILTLEPGWNRGSNNANRGGVSLNGLSGLGNNWLLDGVDMSFGENNGVGGGGVGFNGYLITYVSMDAIQELRATSGAASAEYSRATGGTINVTTKTGTDHFHGAAWEYLRNDALNTSTFFANRSGLPKPSLRQNEFGGNLGGPILKNRLFFFVNYEGARVRAGQTLSGSVPTALLYNQLTNPQMRTFMQKWVPLPTAPTSDPLTGILNRAGTTVDQEDTSLARVDGNFGRHRLSFRMVYDDQLTTSPNLLPGLASGYPLPSRNYTGSWTFALRPTVVNELRIGSNSNPLERHTYALNTALDQNIPGAGLFTIDPAFPGINMRPAAYSGIQVADNLAADAPTKTIVDDLTWVHGAHTIKTGLNFRYTRAHRLQYGNGVWYNYNSIAHLIADQVDTFEMDFGNPGKNAYKFWTYGAYVQDNWKMSRRLTLNYGLHYDYFQALSGPIGLQTSNPFDGTTPLGSPLWRAPKTDFSPRVGVAYLLTGDGKTVLRLGGGIYYGAAQPFFIFDGNWLSATLPAFPTMSPSDFPPGTNLTFPNIDWNFLVAVRNNPNLIPGLAGGKLVPDPNHKDEHSGQYNATLERELSPSLVASVSYVGNRTLHLYSSRYVNLIDPATGIRPYAELGPVVLADYSARLWNNQFEAAVRKKTSHGLAFDAFYTWGHSMTYQDADTTNSRDTVVQDENNIAGSNGPTQGEIRHRFSADYVWSIPTGKGISGSALARGLLDGWALTGIVGANTGGAINIVTNLDAVGNGRAGGQRPDRVPGVSQYLHASDRLAFLNPAAYDTATPVAQKRFGNLGYDTAYGPGALTWDMGIRKFWRIHENQDLAFRFEMFNWLNHVVLSNPTTTSTSGIFGRITSGSNGRQIQMALRYSF